MIAAESLPLVAGAMSLTPIAGGAGGLGGAHLGLRVGNFIKRLSPISDYKVNCWREKLRGNLLKLHTDCRELISQEIKRIEDTVSKTLEHTEATESNKIEILCEKSDILTTWATELQERHTRLTETNEEFKLLADE